MTSENKKIHECSCGHKHNVNLREISLYKGLVVSLFKVLRWCEENKRQSFDMKEIKHLLDKNAYARFGDLYLFGLTAKMEKGSYLLKIATCREFFAGYRTIPHSVLKDPTTGEIIPKEHVHISSIPNLTEFLDENRQYISQYRDPISGTQNLFL